MDIPAGRRRWRAAQTCTQRTHRLHQTLAPSHCRLLTTMLAPEAATAMLSGHSSWPSPLPRYPSQCRKEPALQKTCNRSLQVSATIMLPGESTALPYGLFSWPMLECLTSPFFITSIAAADDARTMTSIRVGRLLLDMEEGVLLCRTNARWYSRHRCMALPDLACWYVRGN